MINIIIFHKMDYKHIWVGPLDFQLDEDWVHIQDYIVELPFENLDPEIHVYHSTRKNFKSILDFVLAVQHKGTNVRYDLDGNIIDFKCSAYGDSSDTYYIKTEEDRLGYQLIEANHELSINHGSKHTVEGLPIIKKEFQEMYTISNIALLLHARRFIHCNYGDIQTCASQLKAWRKLLVKGLLDSWNDSRV